MALRCAHHARTPRKPYPIGLPETGLSICPGWGGANLLPCTHGCRRGDPSYMRGKPMTFDEAVALQTSSTPSRQRCRVAEHREEWIVNARATFGRPGGIPRAMVLPHAGSAAPRSGPKCRPRCEDRRRAADGRARQGRVGCRTRRTGNRLARCVGLERRELTRLRNTRGQGRDSGVFVKAKNYDSPLSTQVPQPDRSGNLAFGDVPIWAAATMADLKNLKGISAEDRKLLQQAEEWMGAETHKDGSGEEHVLGEHQAGLLLPYPLQDAPRAGRVRPAPRPPRRLSQERAPRRRDRSGSGDPAAG